MKYKEGRLVVRVLPSDKTILRHLAVIEGEAMAVVVRRLIREEGKRRHVWPIDEEPSSTEMEKTHDRPGVR